jgi:electron transfer flavoprotein beta subunit
LGVEISSNLKTLSVMPPAERSAGVIVESVEELVNKLKTEAKVI